VPVAGGAAAWRAAAFPAQVRLAEMSVCCAWDGREVHVLVREQLWCVAAIPAEVLLGLLIILRMLMPQAAQIMG
jgi:hypothetical protein